MGGMKKLTQLIDTMMKVGMYVSMRCAWIFLSFSSMDGHYYIQITSSIISVIKMQYVSLKISSPFKNDCPYEQVSSKTLSNARFLYINIISQVSSLGIVIIYGLVYKYGSVNKIYVSSEFYDMANLTILYASNNCNDTLYCAK